MLCSGDKIAHARGLNYERFTDIALDLNSEMPLELCCAKNRILILSKSIINFSA